MDLSNILRKKGMIEILAELQEGDKTFTQIMNAVRLSMSNIIIRLKEGEAYRLINRVATVNEGKVEVKYMLTEKGQRVLSELVKDKKIAMVLKECRSIKKRANEVERELYQLLNKSNINV